MDHYAVRSGRGTAYMLLGFIIAWAIISLLFLSGCTKNLNIKPVTDMTPKEKSLAAIKIYNYQVDSYKARLALPDLSANEKKVLRTEYEVFQRSWPVIKAYDDYIQGITTTIDEAVIRQLDQFLLTYRY